MQTATRPFLQRMTTPTNSPMIVAVQKAIALTSLCLMGLALLLFTCTTAWDGFGFVALVGTPGGRTPKE